MNLFLSCVMFSVKKVSFPTKTAVCVCVCVGGGGGWGGWEGWGGQSGQNGQKTNENYKISIFGSKQWG